MSTSRQAEISRGTLEDAAGRRCANPACGEPIVGRYRSAATCARPECRRYWTALQKRRQRARQREQRAETGTSSELFQLAEVFAAKAELLALMQQEDIVTPQPPRGRSSRRWSGEQRENVDMGVVTVSVVAPREE